MRCKVLRLDELDRHAGQQFGLAHAGEPDDVLMGRHKRTRQADLAAEEDAEEEEEEEEESDDEETDQEDEEPGDEEAAVPRPIRCDARRR